MQRDCRAEIDIAIMTFRNWLESRGIIERKYKRVSGWGKFKPFFLSQWSVPLCLWQTSIAFIHMMHKIIFCGSFWSQGKTRVFCDLRKRKHEQMCWKEELTKRCNICKWGIWREPIFALVAATIPNIWPVSHNHSGYPCLQTIITTPPLSPRLMR